MATSGELPVIDRTYDLVRWSCHHLAQFSRTHRFTLGERMESRLYTILENLIEARYNRDRAPRLQAVNLHLEVLRFQFRLAHDLRCLSTESYGHACRELYEVGGMVGGWLKSCKTP